MGTSFQPFSHLAKPFAIGLSTLDDGQIVHLDDRAAAYLERKLALWRQQPNKVFRAEPETLAAQNEVLAHLLDGLGSSGWVEDRGTTLVLPQLAQEFNKADFADCPLMLVSLLVQDDLVLMRKGDDGWRLVAGSVCFPSSWTLAEKFGRTLEAIHATVPDLNARLGAMINRIFDNLKPELPVWRENWSVDPDDELHQPRREEEHDAKLPTNARMEDLFLRGEYQTLRKLPASGDILFTIKIVIEPLKRLAAGSLLARQFLTHLDDMSEAEKVYKGIIGVEPALRGLLGGGG